jgi:hypothetical protein
VASSAAYTAGGVTVAVIFARTFATRLTDLSSPRSDVAALARALRRR